MGNVLTPQDLAPFAEIEASKAEAMIADAEALALRVAPCLKPEADADLLNAAKAILRRAILRWNETGNSGSRTSTSRQAGPWSETDTVSTSGSRGLFLPSEITQLQELCRVGGKAFTINQVQPTVVLDPFVDRPDLRFQFGWPGVAP